MNQHNALTSSFDKAMPKIQQLGLAPVSGREQLSAIMPLIRRIEHLDSQNGLLIARVMDQSSNFNEIVRTKSHSEYIPPPRPPSYSSSRSSIGGGGFSTSRSISSGSFKTTDSF